MSYEEFEKGIQDLNPDRQALISILWFSGCRISEALALNSDNINCTPEFIYVDFYRLKGSKQTDPIPLPRTVYLNWLCHQDGELFSIHRTTAYRMVKKAFPQLYPHYFRMNRIVDISDKFGDATVYSWVGICAQSIDHYRGKVDIGKVGKALKEELG
jgi:hypothetical protein